jgi:hypothetical protein
MTRAVRLVLLFLFAGVSFQAFSQEQTLSGKLIDRETKAPIEFAQVALFAPESSNPVTYSDTDESGAFLLKVKPGSYTLKVFFIGYSDFALPNLKVSGPQDLGILELIPDNENLQEVVVETTKLPVRTSMEGITITPENNLANTGGTLLDILRTTPSISVADDGTISLRGSSSTNILINGRNSSLTQNLDQLPASAVEEVRVINNPNARYDAEAEGGVIDIILKKGQDFGTHGGLEATYGTRNRTNLGARINHRGAKWNTFAGYNYRDWKEVGTRNSTRILFEEEETLTQETDNTGRNAGHNLNYGADYYFGKNVLSWEYPF